MNKNLYTFKVKKADGSDVSLENYKGKTLLIVNVASQCGFTPQYSALETIYKKYQSQGLEILGFPCNQFKQQESGSDEEIQQFCQLNFGVTFPIFSKIDVNGSQEIPLYKWLKNSARGILGTRSIKWNFTKFLVSPTGEVLKRYAPTTVPEKIISDIEKTLTP